MILTVGENADAMGKMAADLAAEKIGAAIASKGGARIILSTGQSQFELLGHLVKKGLAWDKVEMFHLDEYVGLSASHPASFRRYLKERFADIARPKAAHYVNGDSGDLGRTIAELTRELRSAPVDVAMIGIGENAHVAFNDPPADFGTREAYIVVNLDDACKRQQVGEGWFKTAGDVPRQAITMTVYQIMQAETIISAVSGKRKAQAIKSALEAASATSAIPASKLKEHGDWHLFLDRDSEALLS
jgi:glucosamine-6-phosphate deaminase